MTTSPYTSAYTALPYTDALAKKFTFDSSYDGEVKVYKVVDDGKTIWLPRGATQIHQDLRDEGVAVNFNTSLFKPQKPEQLDVIANTVNLLKADNSFLVCAPTGWGKTYVGSQIVGLMGRRACVVTTKQDIVGQWVEALMKTLGLAEDEIGIWAGDKVPAPHHKVVVGLVQSLMKGPERYGNDAYLGFGLVLCDEVHRMGAEGFSQTMWHFPSKFRLGMSATPFRKDGKDKVFQWHIGNVLVEAKMEVMIPKVLYHKTGWKVPRTSLGQQIPHDFGNITVLMKPLCRNHQRNALIVQYLKSTFEKGRNTIAFSDNLEHLEIITDLVIQAGVSDEKIGYYVGAPNAIYGPSPKTHKEIREKHKYRPILFATYKMASEATNIPWLDTCILMTPRADVEQIVGRIRREYEDKKSPVVIDLVDDDSRVLAHYAKSRRKWYASLGCEIVSYA